MKLIIGLGNPGRKYEATRHNVGFMAMDILAAEHGIAMDKIKHKGFQGDGIIGKEKVVLLKPQTYMNLSGESVREAMAFYKIPPEDILVIYDDISIPPGATRMRQQGSAGGHNGMKSIIGQVGSNQFLRLRIGIGDKPGGWDLADYVLSTFSNDEAPLIRQACERAAKTVEVWLQNGVQAAMNLVNTPKEKKQSPQEQPQQTDARD